MQIKQIICWGFTGSELSQQCWEQLDGLAAERVMAASVDEAPTADALLVKLGAKVMQADIDKLPELKYIGMLGTGYGGIDTAYAASKGITVTNIADYATEGVAEFTIGIVLEHLRDITKAKQQAADGNYSDDFSGQEIKGKTWGVIGLGDIGRRTARLAHAFTGSVQYWSRQRKTAADQAGVVYCEPDQLLSTSDIITLNLALNSETEGFLSKERINQIKPGAIVVNPSPMELIDFDALVERLKQNDITFILDHSDEMTTEQLEALKPLSNCIIYPPIAYLTTEASQLKQQIYVDNLKNYLADTPTNKVN